MCGVFYVHRKHTVTHCTCNKKTKIKKTSNICNSRKYLAFYVNYFVKILHLLFTYRMKKKSTLACRILAAVILSLTLPSHCDQQKAMFPVLFCFFLFCFVFFTIIPESVWKPCWLKVLWWCTAKADYSQSHFMALLTKWEWSHINTTSPKLSICSSNILQLR